MIGPPRSPPSRATAPLLRARTARRAAPGTSSPQASFQIAALRITNESPREQPVNLDEGDQYDWPWMYAVEVGRWNLTDSQAKGLREYLLRELPARLTRPFAP